ncbi:MAG: hypothetical protein RLZZ578_182 [Bacteroidota bacterium]|jgi:hypothetical protein
MNFPQQNVDQAASEVQVLCNFSFCQFKKYPYICNPVVYIFLCKIHMAKKQTFGDKMSKKAAASFINVRVIKPYHTEKGNMKYLERFVRIGDLSEVDKIDINR